MTEEWKDIKDYEGLYQVSNWGRVRSLNYNHTGKIKIRTNVKASGGYLKIGLNKNGLYKNYSIHRLVAETFIPNPLNLPQVNHKNENKQDNRVENLEWISASGNTNYGTRNEKVSKANTNGKCSKTVLQLSLSGDFIREWPSAMEIQRQLGFWQSPISACCRGEKPHYKGFLWKYS